MECLPREYLPDDYHGPCAGTMDELLRKSTPWMSEVASLIPSPLVNIEIYDFVGYLSYHETM